MVKAGDRPDGYARILEDAGMEFQPGKGKDCAKGTVY